MSSKISIIREQNVKQNFYHPWSECQAGFLSSVIGMSTQFQSSVIVMLNRICTRLQKHRHFPQLPSKSCPGVFEREKQKTHQDAQFSIHTSALHPSSLKFQMYFSFAALLTQHFPLCSLPAYFSARSQVLCDVTFCELNIVTCALPQQKLHSNCKTECSFVNVLSHCTDLPCYNESKPHYLNKALDLKGKYRIFRYLTRTPNFFNIPFDV
jgi:hypothetical protein